MIPERLMFLEGPTEDQGGCMDRAQSATLDQRETPILIGSDKVEGTPVFGPKGDRAGRIERVMIDKLSGKVAYAVMSFGGFLGIGDDHYPLPWSLLTYNPQLGGYQVNIAAEQLKGAPKFSKSETWDGAPPASGKLVFDHYGLPPYWETP
jgi:PRC-barrel domain